MAIETTTPKRLLIAFFAFFVLFSSPSFAKYSGGSGTPADPYQIANHNDLYTLADDTNDYEKHFILTADIDLDPNLPGRRTLSTALIAPDSCNTNLDFDGTAFTGTFDGNNFAVLNLVIDTNGLGNDYVGMFGHLRDGGQISNLTLHDVSVIAAGYHAAGLCAYNYDGTISNCHATATVKGANNSQYLGGLIGADHNGVIANCHVDGSIRCGLDSSEIGALVGSCSYSNVRKCYATASVTADHGAAAMGGLVGLGNDCLIIQCFATGPVNAGNVSCHIGGLLGTDISYQCILFNSYATGSVDAGIGSPLPTLGGLAGNYTQVINGYFLDPNDGGGPDNGVGEPLRDWQMKMEASFVTWDFGNTWKICEGESYPQLTWQRYSGGQGTARDPYHIQTYCDLYALADDTNDYNECFTLTADIDLDPNLPGRCSFTTALIAPYPGPPFGGKFDGNDSNILNLTIDTDGIGYDYLALFGQIESAVISNVHMENVNVTGGYQSWYLGSLCAYNDHGSIGNCHATGNITAGWKALYLGGLVGHNYYGTISNCCAAGNVTAGDDSEFLGGLCGYNSRGSISECQATGNVGGVAYIGGLCGYNNRGRISNCYSTAGVNGTVAIGGLCGGIWFGTISNCYATGSVNGYGDSGGLCGQNSYGCINNCYATGNVTGGDYSESLGGLCGYNHYGSISNCYAKASVTGGSNSERLGGLCGDNYYSSISNCYSTGTVNGYDYLGGLCGYNDYGSISNCYFLDTSGPDNGLSTPLTDAQMKQQSSFSRWDFNNETANGTSQIWMIPPGEYPDIYSLDESFAEHQFIGQGTELNPYLIYDACNIGAIWQKPDSYYRMENDIDLTDIGLSTAIVVFFGGTFDGSGYVISNLNINGGSHLGVFGKLTGQVTNLGIQDSSIVGGDYSMHIGGLCGYNYYGSISNCYSTGNVAGGKHSRRLGGLCGTNEQGGISYCYSTGNVTHQGRGHFTGLGGLCGYNSGGIISNSYSTASAAGEFESCYLGGLCGRNWNGSINNCYATGSVSGYDYLGGLCGDNYAGTISHCYFLHPADGGGPDNSLGQPLPDAEFKQQASFTGWDFIGPADGPNDIWAICETTNYPKLLWQIPPTDFLCPDGVTFIDYSYLAAHWLQTDYGDCNGIELTGNGRVDLSDFAVLANWWGRTDCGDCGGADFSGDNNVNSIDLDILCDNWLATDYGDVEGAELTGDGLIDLDDLLVFTVDWLTAF